MYVAYAARPAAITAKMRLSIMASNDASLLPLSDSATVAFFACAPQIKIRAFAYAKRKNFACTWTLAR
jgi:hypothetical protein